MKLPLPQRVDRKRTADGISLRQLAKITGVSFSTLARVDRGEGNYSPETARRLRQWLGDDVSQIVTDEQRAKAEELGRLMARACAAEILNIIAETIS